MTSGDNFLRISSLRYLPRWMVFLIDVCILFISLGIAFYILNKITVLPKFLPIEWKYIIIIGTNILFMYLFKTFAGIIRHSTFIDIQKIFSKIRKEQNYLLNHPKIINPIIGSMRSLYTLKKQEIKTESFGDWPLQKKIQRRDHSGSLCICNHFLPIKCILA